MSNLPSVAVRRWIKWENNQPTEPTSTLVLTSPKSNYVDIRVLLPSNSQKTTVPEPPNSTAEVIKSCSESVETSDISQLDWGFAGTSFRTEATGDRALHGQWRHWVDSKHINAELVTDEGDLFPLYEEDEELELEKGSMIHPQTGQITAYEELWASGVALPDGQSSNGERVCLVLRTTDESGHPSLRGMVIRVGHWVQGIIRRGNNLTVERWIWTDAQGSDPDTASSGQETPNHFDGTWVSVVKIQHWENLEEPLNMPCNITMTAAYKLSEAQIFDYSGIKWKVEETFQW